MEISENLSFDSFKKSLPNAFFYKSYSDILAWNRESLYPEVAFLGRSNSGKSSLINSLLGRKKLAKVSGTPGKTRLINVFQIPSFLSLVDLPGFGYSRVSHSEHEKMMKLLEDYLNESKKLVYLFLLLDSQRKIPTEETEFIRICSLKHISCTLVRTKSDKLNQKDRHQARQESLKWNPEFLFSSSLSGEGIDEIRKILYEMGIKNIEKT